MSKLPKPTPEAEALLKRAYSLSSQGDQAELYRDWAETYEEVMIGDLQYTSPRKCAALLAEHLHDRAARVLDVGCGTGLAGRELAALGYTDVDGLDLSNDMLRVAGSHGIYRKLIEADLLKPLGIDDCSYGGAICTGTFTHAHVGAGCLGEIVRTLKAGAVFAFTVHRDVYKEMGFDARLAELTQQGDLKLLSHHLDTYFDTSEDPEGNFFAYQRT